VTGNTRSFDKGAKGRSHRPVHRTRDPRYHRPHYRSVRRHPHVHYAPPHRWSYRPYYTRWYCHPWYRYQYSTTAVVTLGFVTYAWTDTWVPPSRSGWAWVSGYYAYGYWHPGHWSPVAPPPVHYVYVPGWWDQQVYVEGYYRQESREGWRWVDGDYVEEGDYASGDWVPDEEAPEGYAWEQGFFDGDTWVDGFWRPEYRDGFSWMSDYFDDEGIYHAGYWVPTSENADHAWVPGWFDGTGWIDGYWVEESELASADLESWEPSDGYDDGWEIGTGWGDGEVLSNDSQQGAELEGELASKPLALAVPN
jgi:hypothetical protein